MDDIIFHRSPCSSATERNCAWCAGEGSSVPLWFTPGFQHGSPGLGEPGASLFPQLSERLHPLWNFSSSCTLLILQFSNIIKVELLWFSLFFFPAVAAGSQVSTTYVHSIWKRELGGPFLLCIVVVKHLGEHLTHSRCSKNTC